MAYKTIDDITVRLLNADEIKDYPPELVIGEFAAICHRNTHIDNSSVLKRIAKDCIEKGHGSAVRVAKFRFQVLNIDMATGEQMIRSVIGTEVQKDEVKINKISRRYTPILSDDLYIPESILKSKYKEEYIALHRQAYDLYVRMCKDKEAGIKEEHARCANLWGSITGLNIEYSFEALRKVCEDRLCMRAQKEYRAVVEKMVEEIRKINPWIASYFVPKCKRLGYCPENIGCRALKKDEALEILKRAYSQKQQC